MLRARSFALPLDSHSSSCLSVYSSDFTGVKEQGITERYFGGGKCLSLERNLLERGESLTERRRFFWRGFLELRLLRRGVLGAKDGSRLVLWVSSRGKLSDGWRKQ